MLAKTEDAESGSHLILVRTEGISEFSILLIHTPELKRIVQFLDLGYFESSVCNIVQGMVSRQEMV